MPQYFNQCRIIQVREESICVGSTFDRRGKINRIDRLIQQARLPKRVFQPLQPGAGMMSVPQIWTEQAVDAITERLKLSGQTAGPLGLITVPPRADKRSLMEELIWRLGEAWSSLPVLILTTTSNSPSGYAKELRHIGDEFDAIQLAGSPSQLMSMVGMPGSVTVASVHSLPNQSRTFSTLRTSEIFVPLSHPLLVIVDDAAYCNLGYVCSSIRRYFFHAAFLGLTIDCAPSAQLLQGFGPVIYAYSCPRALQDGSIKKVSYQLVHSHPQDLSGWTQPLANWITERETGQKTSAMLLCGDMATALSLFSKLQSSLGAKRVRIHVPHFFNYSRQDIALYRQIPKES